jgi:hypothetical protein
MRFLTREWHAGAQPDDEAEQTVEKYRRHLAALQPHLPQPLRELSQDINLHDALIRSVEVNVGTSQATIGLRSGDRRTGYFDVDLSYHDVRIEVLDRAVLAIIARDPGTEVLYDEVDVVEDGGFVHRLLFWPYYREVHVVFSSLSIASTPRPSRLFESRPDRYLES